MRNTRYCTKTDITARTTIKRRANLLHDSTTKTAISICIQNTLWSKFNFSFFKNIPSNISSGKPLPNGSIHSGNQSLYNSYHRGRSPKQRNSRNFSQNRYSRSNSQNNHPNKQLFTIKFKQKRFF